MIDGVFLHILRLSAVATFASIVVVLVRMILTRYPKWIICLLWGVVALRLVSPVFFECGLSVVPDFLTEKGAVTENSIFHNLPEDESDVSDIVNSASVVSENANVQFENVLSKVVYICSFVWFGGAFLMILYGFYSYIRIKLRYRDAVLYRNNIFQSEKVTSPFVFGIVKPRIYIPFNLDEKTEKQVILHELSHIKRLDHIWKIIGFLLLSAHWFNPFVWLSYLLFCRDIEIACDEKVIKNYKDNQKKAYARALLECKVSSSFYKLQPIAFGEVGVGVRIKRTINYKKSYFPLTVFVMVLMLLLAFCLLTDPVNAADETTIVSSEYIIEQYKDNTTPEPSSEFDVASTTEPVSINTESIETDIPDSDFDYTNDVYEDYDNDAEIKYESDDTDLTDSFEQNSSVFRYNRTNQIGDVINYSDSGFIFLPSDY